MMCGDCMGKSILKEDVEKLYIDKNYTREETAKELGVSLWAVSKIIKEFGLKKSRESASQKRKETCLKKYGVDNPSKSSVVIEKIKNTNIEKYGDVSFTSTKEGKETIKKTKLERYGNENYNNMEKAFDTKEKRYGDSKYNNREKAMETWNGKYGVDNPFKNKEIIEKMITKKAENMGYSQEFVSMFSNRDKSISFLKDKNYSYSDLMKVLNAPYYTVQTWVTRLGLQDYIDFSPFIGTSNFEQYVYDFLVSIGITNIIRNADILENKREIDLYLPDYNIGIECNGVYWHGSIFRSKNYHQEKSIECEKLGIRLIHIYDSEWENKYEREKIKSIILSSVGKLSNRIYARECTIRKSSNKEIEKFLINNHTQGSRNAQVVYCLEHNGEIVQVMTFSKSKYNKNLTMEDSWEIIRECTLKNTSVVGGESKLLSAFVKEYSPKHLFAYCDFNKFNGSGYERLGMTFDGYTKPNMWFVISGVPVVRNPKKNKEQSKECDYLLYGAGSKRYAMKF